MNTDFSTGINDYLSTILISVCSRGRCVAIELLADIMSLIVGVTEGVVLMLDGTDLVSRVSDLFIFLVILFSFFDFDASAHFVFPHH